MGLTSRLLAGHADVIGALEAEEISVEVGQVVVVALDTLGKLPMPEAPTATGANSRLRPDYRGGQDVIAGVPEVPILAGAGFIAGGVGDVVVVLAVQARDGVEASAVGEGYLLEVFLCERQGPKFAGGWVRGLRYSHCVITSDVMAVLREVAASPGLSLSMPDIIV
jgi:hypothetical protein